MTIVLDLPEDIAKELSRKEGDLSKAVLESLALEGYRAGDLSEEQVRRMLGFDSRFEVHSFLKQHQTYLNQTDADLKHDLAVARGLQRRMIVVADSSVLNYLILIDTTEILLQLFTEIMIPEVVGVLLKMPRNSRSSDLIDIPFSPGHARFYCNASTWAPVSQAVGVLPVDRRKTSLPQVIRTVLNDAANVSA